MAAGLEQVRGLASKELQGLRDPVLDVAAGATAATSSYRRCASSGIK